MYARKAYFRVKSLDKTDVFACAFKNDILPLLRAQPGYKGEIMLGNPGSLERISISLWQSRSDAEVYQTTVYPQVLKMLSKWIDGGPEIRNYENLVLNLIDSDTAGRARA